jgi:hemerythrin
LFRISLARAYMQHQPSFPSTPAVLGYGPMDAIHTEFDGLVRAALASSEVELHGRLVTLIAHLQSHFAEEDAWMRSTEFPASDCHRYEHTAVLRSANDVASLVAAGQTSVGRAFIEELAGWFPGHAHYLDSALAAWMCKRQFGGRPVVLHPRMIGARGPTPDDSVDLT